jgi:hypothetical protein
MSFQPVGCQHSSTELEQFKVDINLAEFACNRFGYTVDAKQSSPNSIVLRKGDDEKLIVARDLDGHYVYFAPITPFATDYGSIIDFIQVRMRVNLGQVRVLLREYQGTNYPHLKNTSLVAKIQPVTKSTLSILKDYESFNQLSYSTYLDSRGLKKELYTSRRFAGKIRVDGKDNLIFPHFDKQGICGFELKNNNFIGFSRGSKKAIWSSNRYSNDKRLVITEAVIDALSYHALFGNVHTRYASTSGAFSDTTKEMIVVAAEALPVRNGAVILAYDNDVVGDQNRRATHQILAQSGVKVIDHIPRNKDFNEDLLHQCRFIKSAKR